jgi:hypothetical protein
MNTWEMVQVAEGSPLPSPRTGHTAVVYNDSMFVYGGKDGENNKLGDIWSYNFQTKTWEEITCEDSPLPRSGHSSQIYKDYMIVYGGIFDICKELNDMHIFDLQKNRWLCLFEEINSPLRPNHTGGFDSNSASKSLRKAGTIV